MLKELIKSGADLPEVYSNYSDAWTRLGAKTNTIYSATFKLFEQALVEILTEAGRELIVNKHWSRTNNELI